ncbi:hypothetical protein BJX70DRAFT_401146 [Aspergillus crustosus]
MQANQPHLATLSHSTNDMLTAPTKLGTLGTLPAEIRLFIYEAALQNGTTALLRTSLTIHNEITHRLYADTVDIHLSPSRKDPHMTVSLRRLHLTWSYNPGECCSRRGLLRTIPLQKCKSTRINIYAPDKGNLGQLAFLWWKLQDLVWILGQRRTLKGVKLDLNLRPRNGQTWDLPHPINPTLHHTSQQPPTSPPSWTYDFFWIPLANLHKDPNRIKPLTDGTTHRLHTLTTSIETYFSVELRTSLANKGPEAAFLRARQDLNMALAYVENGWVWRREEELNEDLPERGVVWRMVPRVVRGLWVAGGFVKEEDLVKGL